MSLLGKGVLAFTAALGVQESYIPDDTKKMVISGLFSLGSLLIVELFKFIKTRSSRKTNQTNVEDKPNKNNSSQSGEITLTADHL